MKSATVKSSRRALAPSPMAPELAGRLRLAIARLARRMRQQADAGITVSALSALFVIDRAGRITLGELAAVERVQRPTMTRIAGALEEAGLVHRESDPADGRVSRLSVSDEGRRVLERTRVRKDAYLAKKLTRLSPIERAAIERALPVLERLLEETE